MLGAIVGDIVGSRFEFNNHRDKDFKLFDEGCCITDDSVMTLAVAQSIMDADRAASRDDADYHSLLSRMTVKNMREIGREYPGCGYGGSFASWMFGDEPKPYNSYGNGAAMRVSAAGFAARSESEAISLSKAVTEVTHNHPEGLKGAEATALAIYMARNKASIDDIRDCVNRSYYPLDFTIDEIRPAYRFNETCQKTVPQSIECFLESVSFEDAIRTAISLGGDSDTIAAITGAIAHAYYGIPEAIRVTALNYLVSRLRAIFDTWDSLFEQ